MTRPPASRARATASGAAPRAGPLPSPAMATRTSASALAPPAASARRSGVASGASASRDRARGAPRAPPRAPPARAPRRHRPNPRRAAHRAPLPPPRAAASSDDAARSSAEDHPLSASTSEIDARTCDLYDVSDVLTPYADAWEWQRAILAARLDALAIERSERSERDDDDDPPREAPSEGPRASSSGAKKKDPQTTPPPIGRRDVLLLVQHPPVVTLGTGSVVSNLKFDPDAPDAPFEVHRVERGGEATYHGPGQLVLYPIMDLSAMEPDLHWYMRALEEVAIRAMNTLGVPGAGRVEGLTGAWANVGASPGGVKKQDANRRDATGPEREGDRASRGGEAESGTESADEEGDDASDSVSDSASENSSSVDSSSPTPLPLVDREHKLAAIGVRARRWVTYHGMALNVDPRLGDFSRIVPCGIGDRPVGSVAQMLQGRAGIVSSAIGSVDGTGGGDGFNVASSAEGSMGGGGFSVDAGVASGVEGPDAELMRRSREAVLDAFEEVFETTLVRRGGRPPVR